MTSDRRSSLRALLHLLGPSRPPEDPTSPGAGEVGLRPLADEHALPVEAIRGLLASTLDTDDIPGFAALDDRRAAVVARLAATPSRTADDLLAKAGTVVMRAAMLGDDGGDTLARSLAVDLVALAEPCGRHGRGGDA